MDRKILLVLILLLLALLLIACDKGTSDARVSRLPIPAKGFVADVHQGRQLYGHYCAGCHGEFGLGSTQGPPLIHKVYEPTHHADLAFYLATKNGVQQHHWQFGNMPPVLGVSPEEAGHIVGYIRQAQHKAGIF